jgi:hypothetical protein
MLQSPTTRCFIALSALAFLLVVSGPAGAEKCSSSKLKAVAKKTKCLLGLEAKEAKSGDAKDPAKVAACGAKMSDAFAKAELTPPCTTTGDAGPIETKVDAFVDDIDTDLSISIPNPCQSNKLKAVAKKAKCLLGIEAKEALKGDTPDETKRQKCFDKFAAAFAKAELGGGCTTTGDTGTIEGKVDVFVNNVDGMLNPGSSTLVCGNTHIDANEECDPPGSSCGGSALCGSDCRCPCDLTGCPCDRSIRACACIPIPTTSSRWPTARPTAGGASTSRRSPCRRTRTSSPWWQPTTT